MVIPLLNLQATQGFINTLKVASLENSGMQQDDIDSIHDPSPVLDLEDLSPLLRSLRHFINNTGSSWAHYNGIQVIKMLDNPSNKLMSFNKVKYHLCWLSGVMPIELDMCPNTCAAYTGPYKDLDSCLHCSISRYFPETTTPQKHFSTMPIGPVIQAAFYGSHDTAELMYYLERVLLANTEQAQHAGRNFGKYDDVLCGKDLLYAWDSGAFLKTNVALQLSIHGAQLHANQQLEAWFFIWVIHNLPLSLHYKKCL